MKTLRKLSPYLVIMLLIGIGFYFTGCKAAREKRKKFNLATTAFVSSTMFSNPLSAVYGDDDKRKARVSGSGEVEQFTGCPMVSFQGLFSPLGGTQNITVSYGQDCISHGLAISGSVTGNWEFVWSNHKLFLDMELAMQDLTVEGLSTDGTIHALAAINNKGPYAQLDGHIATTHANGATRDMSFDNLTAAVDFNEQLLGWFFDNQEEDDTLLNPYDDVVILNGSATYVDEDNMTYSVDFDNMTQNFFCFYPSSGKITIINEAEDFNAIIDMGDGECDDIISITIDDETREVDVSERLEQHQTKLQGF